MAFIFTNVRPANGNGNGNGNGMGNNGMGNIGTAHSRDLSMATTTTMSSTGNVLPVIHEDGHFGEDEEADEDAHGGYGGSHNGSTTTTSSSNRPPMIPTRSKQRGAHGGNGNNGINRYGSSPTTGIGGAADHHHQDGFEAPPPAYSALSEIVGPNGEKLDDLRNNKYIAKRGGWKRLCLIAIVVVLCIVGIVLGVVLGLKSSNNNKSGNDGGSSSSPSSPSPTSLNTTFPAGSYAIATYLSSVSSNCTSNPAAWLCYPYSTYAEDPSAAAATFDWIIQPAAEGSSQYLVSTTDNPFTLMFTNVSLTLMDAGLASERYTFDITMQKAVVPSAPITAGNVMATCYYNNTVFEASLYTSMPNTYPPPTAAAAAAPASASYVPWPYAVFLEQKASSSDAQPDCIDANGNTVGGMAVAAMGEICDCIYMNYDT